MNINGISITLDKYGDYQISRDTQQFTVGSDLNIKGVWFCSYEELVQIINYIIADSELATAINTPT